MTEISAFTNPDERLRPRLHVPMEGYQFTREAQGKGFTLVPFSIIINAASFPELHRNLHNFFSSAGTADDYIAIAIPYHPHGVGIDHDARVIRIGINHLNEHRFEDINFAIAHELGHAWRAQHPKTPIPHRNKKARED